MRNHHWLKHHEPHHRFADTSGQIYQCDRCMTIFGEPGSGDGECVLEDYVTLGWQPIATAPKDRWILLARLGSTKAHIGIWSEDHWEKDGEGLPFEPHVWMPLPVPPGGSW